MDVRIILITQMYGDHFKHNCLYDSISLTLGDSTIAMHNWCDRVLDNNIQECNNNESICARIDKSQVKETFSK